MKQAKQTPQMSKEETSVLVLKQYMISQQVVWEKDVDLIEQLIDDGLISETVGTQIKVRFILLSYSIRMSLLYSTMINHYFMRCLSL